MSFRRATELRPKETWNATKLKVDLLPPLLLEPFLHVFEGELALDLNPWFRLAAVVKIYVRCRSGPMDMEDIIFLSKYLDCIVV